MMNKKEKMQKIIKNLEKFFPDLEDNQHELDGFSLLIATILSQNTSDRNSHRAYKNLRDKFDVKPEVLAQLNSEDIKPIIFCAGLYQIKSKRIVDVSKEILERFGGNLSQVLHLPLEEARKTLMSIKGIGPKTADVFLSFAGEKPIIPIDTNIFRVADRLGFSKGRNYERTRKNLEENVPSNKMRRLHILLIQLGREICKARKPKCNLCPINNLCDYYAANFTRKLP